MAGRVRAKPRRVLPPRQEEQPSMAPRSKAPRKLRRGQLPSLRLPNREARATYLLRRRIPQALFLGRPSLAPAAITAARTSGLAATRAVGTVTAAKISTHVRILQKKNQGKQRSLATVSIVTIGQRLDDWALVIRVSIPARGRELGESLPHGGEPPDPPIDFFYLCQS